MSVSLNPSLTHRNYTWAAWKTIEAAKGGQWQHDETDECYLVWFYDGPEIHITTLWKDGFLPAGVDQADGVIADWEANYKPTSNATLVPKAADGRPAVRLTATNKTKNFKLRAVTFYSSKDISGVHSVNPITEAPYGDITVTLLKKSGDVWVSATAEDAEKTVIDWDPLYAYEVIGGWVEIPTSLIDGTTDQWYLSCVGLPDYAAYGISVDFVAEVNLEAVITHSVVSNGRATQYLSPTIVGGTNFHTNRLRWVIKHPAGVQKRFQICVETFV